ncbi:MAG TPA: hypothetical protein VGR13_04595 [Actinomycetota bacterium]|nr:hypothetical protein [Actinomycetota bacterium]
MRKPRPIRLLSKRPTETITAGAASAMAFAALGDGDYLRALSYLVLAFLPGIISAATDRIRRR